MIFHGHYHEWYLIKEKGMITNMYNKEMLCVRLCDRLRHDKSRVVLITLCDQHPPHFTDEETEGRDFPTFSQGVHVVLRRARSCPGGSLVPYVAMGNIPQASLPFPTPHGLIWDTDSL